MPVSEGDLLAEVPTIWILPLLFVSLIGFYFFALKQLFGSYDIFHILRDYKARSRLQQRYASLFETRENICYHLAASRCRGESAESLSHMISELKSIDKAITEMEAQMKQM